MFSSWEAEELEYHWCDVARMAGSASMDENQKSELWHSVLQRLYRGQAYKDNYTLKLLSESSS